MVIDSACYMIWGSNGALPSKSLPNKLKARGGVLHANSRGGALHQVAEGDLRGSLATRLEHSFPVVPEALPVFG